MEDNEHINKHLKDSLDQFTVQPRGSSFDAIQKKMQNKRKRRFLFFLFPGLLFIAGCLAFYLLQPFSQTHSSSELLNSNIEASLKDTNDRKTEEKQNTFLDKEKQNWKKTESKKDKILSQDKKKQNSQELPSPSNKKNAQKSGPGTLDDLKGASVPGATDGGRKTLPGKNNNFVLNNANSTVMPPVQIPGADAGKEEADHLPIPALFLPLNERQDEVVFKVPDLNPAEFIIQDTTPKKKKVSFLLGAAFNPQAGTYIFSKGASDNNFARLYLENKKEQNSVKFNFSYGLRTGLVIRDKWEILAGFGFQKYVQQEKIKVLEPGGRAPNVNQGIAGLRYDQAFLKTPAKPNETYKSIYKYWSYTLDVSRIKVLNKVTKIKAGIGLQVQQIKYTSLLYVNSPRWINASSVDTYYYSADPSVINKILYAVNLKAGWIENLNKRMQLQINPNLSYSLNSMFNRKYILKQNSLNLGLECLLLFRLR